MTEFAHDFQGLPAICSRCGVHEEGLLTSQEQCELTLPRVIGLVPLQRRLQLRVELMNGTTRFYPLNRENESRSWKIDPTYRTLVIGRGVGRIILPLDNVESISPEEY